MTGKALWQNLKILAECDHNILSLEKQKREAQKIFTTDQELIQKLAISIEEKKNRFRQEQKNVDLQELQAHDLKIKEEAKRTQLANVGSQKEYQAVRKELDRVSRDRDEQEDALLKAWHQLETAQKSYELEEKNSVGRTADLTEDIQAKAAAVQTLEQQLVELHAKRETLVQTIPPEWLVRYDRMKHNVPDPIVPVIRSSCSSCFYAVLHQDLYKLKKSDILPCRSCYRFLYYDQEEEKDVAKAAY
ncbi:hypothetical protein K2X40_01535 [Candidatus Babeliales bacterium]|nr:hypothetical protein [Candidatus Babeliales bacterium]MBY0353378.1 hypothetical protein [Candidatus Babeliales bacterium]